MRGSTPSTPRPESDAARAAPDARGAAHAPTPREGSEPAAYEHGGEHRAHEHRLHERAPDRMTQRVLGVADAVGAFIEAWGFKSIHGKVWCLLAVRSAPTPQAEVAELLGVSRSLVSGAIAELVDFGLVRAVGDHRNAPYEARLDVWSTIADVLRGREWMLMERARVALEGAIEEGEFLVESGESTPYDLDRLRLVLGMTMFAQATLRLVLGWRVPRGVEAFGGWLEQMTRLVRRGVLPGRD